MTYEEMDITEKVGDTLLVNKHYMKNINWHSVRTVVFWACICLAGILQALQGHKVGDFTAVISILGVFEHALNGNS